MERLRRFSKSNGRTAELKTQPRNLLLCILAAVLLPLLTFQISPLREFSDCMVFLHSTYSEQCFMTVSIPGFPAKKSKLLHQAEPQGFFNKLQKNSHRSPKYLIVRNTINFSTKNGNTLNYGRTDSFYLPAKNDKIINIFHLQRALAIKI